MQQNVTRPPQVALRVASLERSLRFYLSLPDFVRASGGAPDEVIGPGGVPLLLGGPGLVPPSGVPEAAPGAWVYLNRPDLPALAAELNQQGITGAELIEPYPGYRHLLQPDPDGYVLAFWESLPVADDEVIALYRSGVDRLRAALAGLTEADLALPRAPGKWTIREIIHHLVDSDLATFHVIRLALALPGRTIHPDVWEPDEWMTGLACADRPIAPAIDLFAASRAWVLEAVATLPDSLSRWVQWPSGYRAEVRDLLRQVGGHAIHHLIQVEETRKKHGR